MDWVGEHPPAVGEEAAAQVTTERGPRVAGIGAIRTPSDSEERKKSLEGELWEEHHVPYVSSTTRIFGYFQIARHTKSTSPPQSEAKEASRSERTKCPRPSAASFAGSPLDAPRRAPFPARSVNVAAPNSTIPRDATTTEKCDAPHHASWLLNSSTRPLDTTP